MTPHASTARWPPLARPARIARTFKGLAVAVGLLTAAQYVAGVLFLQWVRTDPRAATPLTIARYAYYYGARADIHRKLWISTGAGLVLALLPLVLVLRPKAPPLHGNARFSTRAQVRRARLFSPGGIILARLGRRILRLPGQQGLA